MSLKTVGKIANTAKKHTKSGTQDIRSMGAYFLVANVKSVAHFHSNTGWRTDHEAADIRRPESEGAG